MAVVSFGLVGLRFFTNSTLDLRPALVKLPFSALTTDGTKAKAVEKKFKPLVVTILDIRGAVKVTALAVPGGLAATRVAQDRRPCQTRRRREPRLK